MQLSAQSSARDDELFSQERLHDLIVAVLNLEPERLSELPDRYAVWRSQARRDRFRRDAGGDFQRNFRPLAVRGHGLRMRPRFARDLLSGLFLSLLSFSPSCKPVFGLQMGARSFR
jgi:hypothetical protein